MINLFKSPHTVKCVARGAASIQCGWLSQSVPRHVTQSATAHSFRSSLDHQSTPTTTRSFATSSNPNDIPIDTPGRLRLVNKTALITGGGAGIGRATSILFASQGANVIVVDKNRSAANDTVNIIQSTLKQHQQQHGIVYNNQSTAITCDLSKGEQIKQLFESVEQQTNELHILFNNAGIQHLEDDNAEKTREDIWDLTFDINVKAVWLGCKYGIPLIRRSGGGSIINTASFVAKIGAATSQLAYTSSKGAVLAMSKELAVIHARENIRVNALCPGPLRTKLLMDFLNTKEKKERRLVHVPMGRFGEAEELARAALFLASDESSYMTGSEFLVDGGITAAYVTPEGETNAKIPK